MTNSKSNKSFDKTLRRMMETPPKGHEATKEAAKKARDERQKRAEPKRKLYDPWPEK